MSTYLLLDSKGRVLYESPDPLEIAHAARRTGRFRWLAPFHESAPPAAANPTRSPAENALALTGLAPVAREEVESLSRREAWDEVRPFFDEARRAGGERGSTLLKKVLLPGYGLLTENAKLHKRDPQHPSAFVLGLALLPEFSAFRGETAGGVALQPMKTVPARAAATLCAGSSAECRRSCLVYSGQNQSNRRNNFAKLAKAKALLMAPRAFLRLLLEAVGHYARTARISNVNLPRGTVKFLRLNVFSDVPWELLAPWIFDAIEERKIVGYDYTKLPGRAFLRNYDLSFSYSGTNLRACDAELRSGRRLVMVFAAPEYSTPQAAKARAKRARTSVRLAFTRENPLPEWVADPGLLGGEAVPVVDGDLSDIRPFDPPGVVVGLRWKPPKGTKVAGPPEHFVVTGEVVRSSLGRAFMLPETPLSRPSEART